MHGMIINLKTNARISDSNLVYKEIDELLQEFNFDWIGGSLFINKEKRDGIADVYKAIKLISGLYKIKNKIDNLYVVNMDTFSDFSDIIHA